jgi:predicted ATPase
VIASLAFLNFKALRDTRVALLPFNLMIGPNGSGKTSLIEAVQRLRTLSRLPLSEQPAGAGREGGPEIECRFTPPHEELLVRMECVTEGVCDTLRVVPRDHPGWPALCTDLGAMRRYELDHDAMAAPCRRSDAAELRTDGGNLAAVLAQLSATAPAASANLTAELRRILPEFEAVCIVDVAPDTVGFELKQADGGVVPAAELSQGTLYLLGLLALAFDPTPPTVLCIEEIDRGIHPRMLREVRDALYRLSHPQSFAVERRPVQVIATTHSPYLIDLFRDHPEEVVVTQKRGSVASFQRLTDRPDLPELLREGALGDLWFSGILGGMPEER